MTDVVYEFDTNDPLIEDVKALLREANTDLFRAKQQWRKSVWEPYQHGLLQKEYRAFRFNVDVKTADEDVLFCRDTIEFELDENLFNTLVEFYANYGWRGFQAFKPIIDEQPLFRRTMLYASLQCVDDLVANRLIELQRQATELGRQNITTGLNWVFEALKCFNKKHELIIATKTLDELYPLLNECRRLQNKIRALDEKISERNRKDGRNPNTIVSKRNRDEYRRVLVKHYQDPKDEKIKQLTVLQERIAKLYAPAILILNDLDSDLSAVMTTKEKLKSTNTLAIRKSREVELIYQQQIYQFLTEMHDALTNLNQSYGNPGIETIVRQYQTLNMLERFDAGGVHKIVLSKVLEVVPGVSTYIKSYIRYGVFGFYFTEQQRRDYHLVNRVLGRPSVISLLQDSMLDERATSFQRAVLLQYNHDLERALQEQEKRDAIYETIWHCVELTAATVGLILAILAIPFGAGAVSVPAAITTALTALSLMTLVLGIPLLVRGLLTLLDGAMRTSDSSERKLVELELTKLGNKDINALLDLSKLLHENHLLLDQASVGLLKELIKAATAHELKPIAFMIDMEGYLDDMETLGASF